MAFAGGSTTGGFTGSTQGTTTGGFGGGGIVKGFAEQAREVQKKKQKELKDRTDAILETIKKKEAVDDSITPLDDDTKQFADDFLDRIGAGDMDDPAMDAISKLIADSVLLDQLDALNDMQDQDFIATSLRKYGINPLGEGDVQDGTSIEEYKKQIGDEIQVEFNNLFDGIGKVLNGLNIDSGGALDDLEAYTDVIRAIVDDDPRYLILAVEEKLGLEFDENGDLDVSATLRDNLSPILGRYMSNNVFRPLIRKIGTRLSTTFGLELEEGILAAEIADTEALATATRALTSSFAEVMGEGVGTEALGSIVASSTEGFAPLFIAVGVLESVGAIGELTATLMSKLNTNHRAYTEGNHRWFGDGSDWLAYTGPIYSAMKGIADATMEIRDYQDWKAGTTTYQQYLEDKLSHDLIHSAFQEAMEHIAKGEEMTLDKTMKMARETPAQGGVAKDKWEQLLVNITPEKGEDVSDYIGSFFGGKRAAAKLLDGTAPRTQSKKTEEYVAEATELLKFMKDVLDGTVDLDYTFDTVEDSNKLNMDTYMQREYEGVSLDQYNMLSDMVQDIDDEIVAIRELQNDTRALVDKYSSAMQRKRDWGFYLPGSGGNAAEEEDNQLLRDTRDELKLFEDAEENLLQGRADIKVDEQNQFKLLEAMEISPFYDEARMLNEYNRVVPQASVGTQIDNLRWQWVAQLVDQGQTQDRARRLVGAGQYAGSGANDDMVLSHFNMSRDDLTVKPFDTWLSEYMAGLRQRFNLDKK